jgi:cold shock CspA family protein
VTSYDGERGLGEVEADDGGVYGFHCTALADGSRQVDAGTRVAFLVVAGRSGEWEASSLLKL